jgi:hypothetical protein
MPTILASAIINKAEIVLQDTTNVRWSESELLGWLNDGQREIALLRPDVSNVTASVALVAGTKQALPSTGTMLMKITRNMGTNGTTAGPAVRKVPQDLLDSQRPNWHTDTATAVVQHYTFDLRTPRIYYVWPPSLGTTQVEMVYAAPPADVAAIGNAITIDDIYANVLINYILYRAYSKDMELAGNAARAEAALNLFNAALGGKANADAASVAKDNIAG